MVDKKGKAKPRCESVYHPWGERCVLAKDHKGEHKTADQLKREADRDG